MKILNLYCGIGGNRKNWGDKHKITAIENVPEIAKIYQDFFPNDKVIITDAHQYLLDHYKDFDFIWSSPPCPTHSQVGRLRAYNKEGTGQYSPAKYPDMKLYEEILFLQGYFKGKWCVENVIAWYKPLIPCAIMGGHQLWSNFYIEDFNSGTPRQITTKGQNDRKIRAEKLGFNLDKYTGIDKRLALRDCTEPELGKHILDLAINPINLQGTIF
jgi:DNA (cytosine-5)-methyltransferase 1